MNALKNRGDHCHIGGICASASGLTYIVMAGSPAVPAFVAIYPQACFDIGHDQTRQSREMGGAERAVVGTVAGKPQAAQGASARP
jgi:hypothetical protein